MCIILPHAPASVDRLNSVTKVQSGRLEENTTPITPKVLRYETSSFDTNWLTHLDYLESLLHSSALCDRCMTRIQGEWFRCAYCPKDLCDACEALDTHDDSHVFFTFKAPVRPWFRVLTEKILITLLHRWICTTN